MITHKRERTDNDVCLAYELFDDIDELIYANRNRQHRIQDDHTLTSELDAYWNGCSTYAEAESLALNGWNELIADEGFTNFYNARSKSSEDKLMKQKNDVVGYAPIVPHVLMNIPQTMINFEKKKVKSKILSVAYNISCTSGYSKDDMKKAGFNFMNAIIDLERQGYRLKIVAVQDYTRGKDVDLLMVDVKNEYRKLDLLNSMFTLIHPAMFRTIGFVWKERSPVTMEMSGYGTSFKNAFGSYEKLEKDIGNVIKDKNTILVNGKDIIDKSMTTSDIEDFIIKGVEK